MRSVLLALALAGCAHEGDVVQASVTRMMSAPPREATCSLEFVQASMMELSPMGKYDILGYVHLSQLGDPDPMAEANRRWVRPKACELGGKYVSIMLNSANTTSLGTGSGTLYAVLRDKSTTPAAPQPF